MKSRFGQFSQVFAIRLYGAATAFFVTLLLGRLLGPAEFGAYAFAMSWVSLFILAATFGFHHFMVRSLPPLIVRDETAEAKGIIVFAIVAVGLLSLLVSIFAFLNTNLFATDPNLQNAVGYACLLVLPVGWTLLRTGILQGLGRPVAGLVTDRIVAPCLLLAVLLICTAMAMTLDATEVLLITFSTTIVSLLIGLPSLKHSIGKINAAPSFRNVTEWTMGAAKSGLDFAALAILAATDVVMLGMLSTAEETGIYGIAARFFLLMALPTHAAVVFISQRTASLHQANDTAGLADMARGAANRGLVAAIVLAIPATVAAFFMEELFGPGFGPALVPALILVWVRVLMAVAGQPDAILAHTNFVGTTAAAAVLAAILNIGLNAALIPSFGANGAALATSTSNVLMIGGLMWALHKRLGILSFVGRTH